MNLSRITSLEWWEGLAQEAIWKITPQCKSQYSRPTWPLDSEELKTVTVFWPSKYEWAPSYKWVEPLRCGLAKYVPVEHAPIAQPYPGIVLIQIRIQRTTHDIAIDYSDYPTVNENCADRCSLYFKMQFPGGRDTRSNILPGGFVPFRDDLYTFLPHIRHLADQRKYSFEVYGRFGSEFASEVRRKACSLLTNQNHFRWEGSLSTKRYSLSLHEIARSKICIDLPGNGDFCFRLVDYMAVGACIIARKHSTTMPVPLVDGEQIVYAKEDLSDLVELCRFFLDNDEARETLRRNSRAYFDRYLRREQLASYYLHESLRPTVI